MNWIVMESGNDYEGHSIWDGDEMIACTVVADPVEITEEEELRAHLLSASPDMQKALDKALPILKELKSVAYAVSISEEDVEDAMTDIIAALKKSRGL